MPGKRNTCSDCGRPAAYYSVRCKPCENVRRRGQQHTTAPDPNPSGLCLCGCGRPTSLARKTDVSRGFIRGKPIRYCRGHSPANAPHPVPYVIDPASGCWLWQRGRDRKGYGHMRSGGRPRPAHRVYYEAAKGPIPAGLCLDHLCCNPSCVNPDHLDPVTKEENTRRGAARRRARRDG